MAHIPKLCTTCGRGKTKIAYRRDGSGSRGQVYTLCTGCAESAIASGYGHFPGGILFDRRGDRSKANYPLPT